MYSASASNEVTAQAGGGFVMADLLQQIDACFSRAHQCAFCNDITFASLLLAADQTLLSLSVIMNIAYIQFYHLSKLASIICMSNVMNTSSQTLELSHIRNHFFCATYFKLCNC